MYASLPKLNYSFFDLEPHIDTKTMQIHYEKHHGTYVTKLNELMDRYSELSNKELSFLLKNINSLKMEENDKVILRNHGGGHINHSLFFSIMGPKKAVNKSLEERIINKFGSVANFKEEFSSTALNKFGSGWAFLVDSNGELKIYATSNQDSPYMNGDTPLIGLDVWEHAYYLKYQNLRADYIKAWFNVLNII